MWKNINYEFGIFSCTTFIKSPSSFFVHMHECFHSGERERESSSTHRKKQRKEGGRMLQMAMLLCLGMLTAGHGKVSQLEGGHSFRETEEPTDRQMDNQRFTTFPRSQYIIASLMIPLFLFEAYRQHNLYIASQHTPPYFSQITIFAPSITVNWNIFQSPCASSSKPFSKYYNASHRRIPTRLKHTHPGHVPSVPHGSMEGY